ncbi:hypothetical protein BTO03_18865, partial [Vibrio parahaemolyticus]
MLPFPLALVSSVDRTDCLIWNGKFEGELPILDSNSLPLNKAALSDEEKLKAILRWSALPG